MYLHIGQEICIDDKNIIGIFDVDTSTVKKITRDFLNTAEKNKELVTVGYDIPLSFIVCATKNKKNEKKQTVYLSPVSSVTLNNKCKKGMI